MTLSPLRSPLLWVAFLGAVIFFGRFFLVGLSPDAALYAGLSWAAIQQESIFFLHVSTEVFPVFYEHPPFVFIWGSWLLSVFGDSDGVARAIGALPAYLSFLSLIFWLAWRSDKRLMLICALMLLSFGHFTKYATTSMLDAPLSLGVLWVFIAAAELLFFQAQKSLPTKSILHWLLLGAAGAAIATASKGVAGMGAVLAVFIAMLFMCSTRLQKFLGTEGSCSKAYSISIMSLWSLAALLPLGLWAYLSHPAQGGAETWPFREYLSEQVFRSATTDRGSELYPDKLQVWTYLWVILKYGWPWWWTVPGLWLLLAKKKPLPLNLKSEQAFTYRMAFLGACFFFAFFIPFSLTRIQLPHYLHPTYMPLAVSGALFFWIFLKKYPPTDFFNRNATGIWGLCILVATIFVFSQRGLSSTGNRGQEFYNFKSQVQRIPKDCPLIIERSEVDAYRMAAFSLWYWKGHPWAYHLRRPSSEGVVFLQFSPQAQFDYPLVEIKARSGDCHIESKH